MNLVIKNNPGLVSSIVLFLIVNITSFIMAKIISYFPSFFSNIYSNTLIGFILPIITLPCTYYLVKFLKSDISSLGITKKNFTKSLSVGVLISICLFIIFGGDHNDYQNVLVTPTIIMLRILYFLICVSVVEEIVFRGFIRQNIWKNKKALSYLLSGILFSFSHVTFHSVINHISFIWFILNRWQALLFYVLIHLFLQIIYDKYQNCAGPIAIHFVIDFFGLFSM